MAMQNNDTTAPAIGSTVRFTSKVVIPSKPGPKRRGGGDEILTVARRSIVATLPDEAGRISLVQDDLAPAPLARRGKFMIAPQFHSVGVEVKECEALASDVMPLLEFEGGNDHREDYDATEYNDVHVHVQRYKDRGDQLLRLNDYTCAISYYEAALSIISSQFEVGGTLIVKKRGHATIAEVDCIDDDGNGNIQYDVTFLSGEEGTITQKDILLAVFDKDPPLQTKILLNLSRCLLKLASLDTTVGNASCVGERSGTPSKSSRQERYRSAAVLGCSIAITSCEHVASESCNDDTEAQMKSLIEKARIVRSRAFLGLRKLPNATVDAKKVIVQNPESREAQVLLAEIKSAEAYKKSVDKKLSKEVAKWVHTATTSSNGAEAMGRMDDDLVSEDDSQNDEESRSDSGRDKIATQSGIDIWKLVRRTSFEISGVVAFLIAMFILYPQH